METYLQQAIAKTIRHYLFVAAIFRNFNVFIENKSKFVVKT